MSVHHGIETNRLDRLREAVSRHVGPDKLAGVVTLVAKDGEVVHSQAQGLQDRESETEMRPDSIFRIYSMTKPITSVASMILHEEGAFQLHDPISKYLPAARDLTVMSEETGALSDLEREVTVRDLLSHTAGFTYPFADSGRVEELYRERPVFGKQSLEQFISEVLDLPLAFQPGSNWRYGISTDVLARVVERAADQPFDEFISQRILRPLGMVDTAYFVTPEKRDRLASMYGSMNLEDPGVTKAEQLAAAERGDIKLLAGATDSRESEPHNVIRGGHGLLSTARDYFRFCQMLLNYGELDGVRILGRKSVELMTRNTLPARLLEASEGIGNGEGFGLGFGVVMDSGVAGSIGSSGRYHWGGAASTSFWIDPAERLIGIQMAQFQPGGFYPVGDDFLVAVYQALV